MQSTNTPANAQTEKLDLLSWEVQQSAIYTAEGTLLHGHKAITRSDNQQVLNLCKSSYTPTTNARFAEIVEEVARITNYELLGFSEFEAGKKVMGFLKVAEPMHILGYEFKENMVIGNSHDGTTSLFMGNSSIMVRCKNRFGRVFRQLKVNHTKNQEVKISQLLDLIDNFHQERQKMALQMQKMASVKIDQTLKDALKMRLLKLNEEEVLGGSVSTRTKNIIADLDYSITRECSELGDNLFGLFNGATHYTTHIKKVKHYCEGNMLGSAAEMNEDAFKFCLAHSR